MVAVVIEQAPEQSSSPSRPIRRVAGRLAVGAGASFGAGVIHAAAVGVHGEHRQAALVFTLVAATQLGWPVAVHLRPSRSVVAVGAAANVGILAGWVLAKTVGIGVVDGLEAAEAVQVADGLAAVLALIAASAAASHLRARRTPGRGSSPVVAVVAAVALAAVALPGMYATADHVHVSAGHDHDDEGSDAGAAVARPYDPELPIDLGGVDGVTPQQQARAENLIAITLARLPRFADHRVAEANGFVSIGDGSLGHEHYLNTGNMTDDRILDPDVPESLVYDTSVTPKRLVAAMYMLNAGDTLDDVPDIGGPLTQWHVHDDLCFVGLRVVGTTGPSGECPPGTLKGAETPMIHVWIVPHRCGPFAALDGVAGGRIPDGEERLCDHAHGS